MTDTTSSGPHAGTTDIGTRVGLEPVGVWFGTPLGGAPAASVRTVAEKVESWRYGAIWIGEAPGFREVFTHAGLLLAATRRIVVATGIANIRIRDPLAANAAARTLADAYPGRFVLGLGSSHAATAGFDERTDKPLTTMRRYLEALDAGPEMAPPLRTAPTRVVAALRAGMQGLGRDHADGVHTFCVPPDHTADARARLGDGPLLIAEQGVVLDDNPVTARRKAREHLRTRLRLSNYANNFRAMGFTDEDLAGDGSDHFVDRLVAWGDESAIAARVREHLDAGADQVAVHPIDSDLDVVSETLGELAGSLIPSHSTERAPR